MLAKLCLEKEPETFLPKRQHVLVELIDAFMESDDDRRPDEGQMKAASEALAALHVAIKNSIKVGSTQFNPEITVHIIDVVSDIFYRDRLRIGPYVA